MRTDKFIFWCDACDSDHTVDADEIPCPVEQKRLERQVETLQAENDRLTDELDDLKADIKTRAGKMLRTLDAHDLNRTEQPATLPA